MCEKAMPFRRCKFSFGLCPQWHRNSDNRAQPFPFSMTRKGRAFPHITAAEPRRKVLPIQNQNSPTDSSLISVFSSLPASLHQPRKHRLMSYSLQKTIIFYALFCILIHFKNPKRIIIFIHKIALPATTGDRKFRESNLSSVLQNQFTGLVEIFYLNGANKSI